MSTEGNKTLMHRFLEEVFNKKNLSALDEFIAPNQVDHTLPAFLPTTPEGTKRAIGMYLKAFPDLHLTVEDMFAEGDKVVTRFTSRGTQKGAFVGMLQQLGVIPALFGLVFACRFCSRYGSASSFEKGSQVT